MSQNNADFDVIILGAGPAGMAAGIYAARKGMKTLILEGGMPGGRAATAPLVENYPAIDQPLTGLELTQKMYDQLKRFGGQVTNEEAISLQLDNATKTVRTRKGEYTAKSVIIAIGVIRKKLLIPGEAEFLGTGVSYCAVCDGPLLRGKRVAVIGPGEEALEDTAYLADISSEVFLVSNEPEFSGSKGLLKRLKAKGNVEILEGYKAQSIEGEQFVQTLRLKRLSDGEKRSLGIDGVFIVAGVVPMTDIIRKAGVKVDKRGCILVDRRQATNTPGVFAAGDCTCGGMQIATAVGEGVMAAIAASRLAR